MSSTTPDWQPGWKVGLEIELAAPRGRSRLDLARTAAARHGGTVTRFFHHQSEVSKVPGQPVFDNLTPGFRVADGTGRHIADFVDDLTLQRDFHRDTPSLPGWYRIMSDDPRLLHLISQNCPAEADFNHVLEPLAALFGSKVEHFPGPSMRVRDKLGAPVALGSALPGERERPCEIVTAPLERDHLQAIADLLEDAAALGFIVPVEGATHVHFDAAALRSAPVMARLITMLARHRQELRQRIGANPNCVRLGHWPDKLVALARDPAFARSDWPTACTAMEACKLTKYCDFNLVNLIRRTPGKDTIEFRIMPSTMDKNRIAGWIALFEGLLRWSLQPREIAEIESLSLDRILAELPLDPAGQKLARQYLR